MQTNKQKSGSPIKRPAVRKLKIQPKIRFNRYGTNTSPEIKLCGNWLQQLGFDHGQDVFITTMDRLLILRVEKDVA